MSGAIGTYGFINAKIRTKRSFLLTNSDFRKLADSKSIQEFYTILSHTRYQHFVENAKGATVSKFEYLLLKIEIEELQAIIKKCPKVPLQIINLLLKRYDVERLKALLRHWHQKSNPHEFLFSDSIIHDFPVDAMLQAERFSDVIQYLFNTEYQKVLENQISVYENQKSLFKVELALDKDIFRQIDECIQELPSKDKEISRRLLGLEIDLINIQWLYRFKTYYSVKPPELSEYLIPRGNHFDTASLNLSKDFSFGALIHDLLKPSHKDVPDETNQEKDFTKLEQLLYTLLKREANRAFRQPPFSIGSLLGYYYLMRIEMKNIRALFSAKQYGMSPEACMELLIL